MSRSAAGVAETLSSKNPSLRTRNNRRGRRTTAPASLGENSEKAQLLGAVAHQHVLRLLIVIEHHLMGFATDTRLLVSAERRMCRIGVIAVGPYASRLDRTTEAIEPVRVTTPNASAEAIERVVGDRQCL